MPDYVIFVVAKGQVESSMNIIEAIYVLLYQSFFILQPLYPEFFSGVIGKKTFLGTR